MWDELDVWHSCLAALEVDVQDLEKPEEMLALTEKLVEVQQLHSQLAKQAEQRTTLISKVREPPSLPVSLLHAALCPYKLSLMTCGDSELSCSLCAASADLTGHKS